VGKKSRKRMMKKKKTNGWIATRGGEPVDARWKAEDLDEVHFQLIVRMTKMMT
jgi:hypothetical protein